MIEDIDIWRVAKLSVDWRGPEAPARAAIRVGQMLDDGDTDG